jgi:Transposase DDE domain
MRSAGGKRKFGYSRDKRSDCVQVVIALIVTRDGFPLAYEVMDGNTSDKTTLKEFLAKIEKQYGEAKRTWVMDRGIPTEEVLAEMRAADLPVSYLVGAPKGRLSKLEKHLVTLPWQAVREGVDAVALTKHGVWTARKSDLKFIVVGGRLLFFDSPPDVGPCPIHWRKNPR